MVNTEFIFCDKYRFRRHLVFWIAWWLFCIVMYSFAPGLRSSRLGPLLNVIEAAAYLAPHMFLSYMLIYWVLPRFLLKGKYILSAISVLIIFLITAAMSAFIAIYLLADLRRAWLPVLQGPAYARYYNATFFLALLAGLRGGITIGGLAAAIKLMKHWTIKEQKNMQLKHENMQTQLQLLKAQVHPHFLFNTLNNIYSYTQNTSPVASKLVMGLSDMLRYMLYECDQSLVPLNKEIQMLEDFIMLEKIRYGNKLDVTISISPEVDKYRISPLLLLPFIENAFKHGTSQMLEQPWLSMIIDADDSEMHFKLINGKPAAERKSSPAHGIGIMNVRKRLELLYEDRHSLEIDEQEDVFIVDLKINLDKSTHPAPVSTRNKPVDLYA